MENRTMRVAGFLKVFCCGSAVLLGVTEARADSGAWNNIASGDWNTPPTGWAALSPRARVR